MVCTVASVVLKNLKVNNMAASWNILVKTKKIGQSISQTSSCIRGRLQGEGSTDSSDPDEGRLGLEDDSFCSASI